MIVTLRLLRSIARWSFAVKVDMSPSAVKSKGLYKLFFIIAVQYRRRIPLKCNPQHLVPDFSFLKNVIIFTEKIDLWKGETEKNIPSTSSLLNGYIGWN